MTWWSTCREGDDASAAPRTSLRFGLIEGKYTADLDEIQAARRGPCCPPRLARWPTRKVFAGQFLSAGRAGFRAAWITSACRVAVACGPVFRNRHSRTAARNAASLVHP